jgi:hypothetical protein
LFFLGDWDKLLYQFLSPVHTLQLALAGEAMLIAVTSVPAATTPTNNATIIAF